MKTVIASVFKAKCLKIMDEVAESGEEVVVTKNGVPLGKFVPYRKKPKSLWGLHAGELQTPGDVVAPVGEPWSAGCAAE